MNPVLQGRDCIFVCGSCSTRITSLASLRDEPSTFGGICHATFTDAENVQIRADSVILVPSSELQFANEECSSCHHHLGVRILQSENPNVGHLFPIGLHCLILNEKPPQL